MSAPKTNVEKQTRRHRPALIGIAVAVVLGVLFFLLNVNSAVDDAGPFLEGVDNDGAPAFSDEGVGSPAVTE